MEEWPGSKFHADPSLEAWFRSKFHADPSLEAWFRSKFHADPSLEAWFRSKFHADPSLEAWFRSKFDPDQVSRLGSGQNSTRAKLRGLVSATIRPGPLSGAGGVSRTSARRLGGMSARLKAASAGRSRLARAAIVAGVAAVASFGAWVWHQGAYAPIVTRDGLLRRPPTGLDTARAPARPRSPRAPHHRLDGHRARASPLGRARRYALRSRERYQDGRRHRRRAPQSAR
jgi:hypothetical protein